MKNKIILLILIFVLNSLSICFADIWKTLGDMIAPDDETQKNNKIAVYGLNQRVNVGYWTYRVWSREWKDYVNIKNLYQKYPSYRFLRISIVVENNSREASNLPPIKLVDEDGNEYDREPIGLNILERINPTLKKDGFIFFDVPSYRKYKLKVSGGFMSNEYAYIELD